MLREARLTQSPEDRVRMETLPRRAWGSRELAAATLHLGGGGGKGEAIEDRSHPTVSRMAWYPTSLGMPPLQSAIWVHHSHTLSEPLDKACLP